MNMYSYNIFGGGRTVVLVLVLLLCTVMSAAANCQLAISGNTVYGIATGAVCTTIEAADFGNATAIEARAFSDTGGLDYVIIPDTITSIGDEAFAGANTNILMLHSGVTLGNGAFRGSNFYTTQNLNINEYPDAVHKGTTSYLIDRIQGVPESITLDVWENSRFVPSIYPSHFVPSYSSDLGGSQFPGLSVAYNNASVVSVYPDALTPSSVAWGPILVTGLSDGTDTLTLTAAPQIGYDIFGDAVPAIPSVTIPVTVGTGASDVPTTGGEGGDQQTAGLDNYLPPMYANPVVSANGDTQLGIVNVHIPEQIEIEIVKLWDDDDNRDHLRPESICMTLHAAAGSVNEAVNNITLDSSDEDENDPNKWTVTLSGKVKNFEGTQIAYTVTEAEGECSELTYTENNCKIAGGKWADDHCNFQPVGPIVPDVEGPWNYQ